MWVRNRPPPLIDWITMCINCDDFLTGFNPYKISPTCDDIYASSVTINVSYSIVEDWTILELRSNINSMHNMTYVMTNEWLTNIDTESLVVSLRQSFRPFFKFYPHAEKMLVDFIRKQHKPQGAGSKVSYKKADVAPVPSTLDFHHIYYSQEGTRPKELNTFPGLKERVHYPGAHPLIAASTGQPTFTMTLERAIIRLNDRDKWTREQIADWLESLDVDITFKTKENEDAE